VEPTSALLSSAVAASRPSNDSATITIQHESQLGADVVNHNGLIDSKPILTKVIYLGVRFALYNNNGITRIKV
jgi:hypothetical protein